MFLVLNLRVAADCVTGVAALLVRHMHIFAQLPSGASVADILHRKQSPEILLPVPRPRATMFEMRHGCHVLRMLQETMSANTAHKNTKSPAFVAQNTRTDCCIETHSFQNPMRFTTSAALSCSCPRPAPTPRAQAHLGRGCFSGEACLPPSTRVAESNAGCNTGVDTSVGRNFWRRLCQPQMRSCSACYDSTSAATVPSRV